MSTIFIDFDGTLIDISDRFYAVYRDIISEYSSDSILSKDEYWETRRTGLSFVQLVEQTHDIYDKDQLLEKYLLLIEKCSYLSLDYTLKKVENIIKFLKRNNNVVLVTLRHNYENLYWQLSQLNLTKIFDEILSASGGKNNIEVKRHLIENSKFFGDDKKYMVGDTEVDVESGRQAGCVIVAVSSGLRNRKFLSGYSPNYLKLNISELPSVFNNVVH